MLKSYFTIAWRNLVRNRRFSLINIIGLSLSVAFCLLLFFYIRWEQGYDRFNRKKDRLVRLESTSLWDDATPKKSFFSFLSGGGDVKNQLVWPVIVGRDIKANFPEVKSMTRWSNAEEQMMRVNGVVMKVHHLEIADANFLENFSFRVIRGDAEALHSPKQAVVSASTAKRFFGDKDPIGRVISMADDSSLLYTVAAVAEDAPSNSSIQYDVVLPLEGSKDYQERVNTGFNTSSHLLVLELNEGVDRKAFSEKLNKWARSYFVQPFVAEYGKYYPKVDFSKYRWVMRSFAEAHYNAAEPWGHYTNSKNIYQLGCLVVVILLIASLNYLLLVISNAATRSQEVGVRKVLGAKKGEVILQFWVETQIVVCISVLVGLGLSGLLLPLFNKMLGVDLHFGDFVWKDLSLALAVLTAGIGLLAGYYPALFMSKMKPLSIIKTFRTFKVNPGLSQVLVGIQFTACIVLMLSVFVMERQMRFINDKDLGFDKEQVLMVENPIFDGNLSHRIHDRLKAFAGSDPDIVTFSGMSGNLSGNGSMNGFRLNGEQKWRTSLGVDYGYFDMLGLKLVKGRFFSPLMATDTMEKTRPVVVNEVLWNMLGPAAKLGEFNEPLHRTIIGVVKNYHYETLSKAIEPQEHELSRGYIELFMFKVRAGRMNAVMPKVEKEWKLASGNFPFDYHFLNESISAMYEADRWWQTVTRTACLFAVFIACMGLFGLSAINAANRMKEIGIRKVLGAEGRDIFLQLARGFFGIVGVAILVATPVAWWIMHRWLEDFAYRIELSWWMFVLVGFVVFAIALVTVSYQTVKAALANPVDSLRTE